MADFDKIVHEPVRLRILTLLATSDDPRLSFREVQDALELSAGNLSVQLRKLQDAGYTDITKEFRDNKPLTTVAITASGSEALKDYVSRMEAVIASLKQNR